MKKCLFPCLRNEEKPDALSFFLGIFFSDNTRLGGGGCFDKECFKPVSSAKETSLKIEISPAASLHMILSKKQKKGADQTARMRRLVCACVVHKPPKTGFLASRPIL